jgi:hypothetical protein
MNSQYRNRLNSKSVLRNVRYALKNQRFRNASIYSKMKRISKNSPWIRVDSAFGGFAIYRAEIFFMHNYDKPEKNGPLVSEHVDFHYKIINSKLYINPGLINANWNTYNLNRFPLIRYLRVLIRKSNKIRDILKKFMVWKSYR